VRRSYLAQNTSLLKRLFPWLRSTPSTPIAVSPVVVMTDSRPKADMEQRVTSAFSARGIEPEFTRVRVQAAPPGSTASAV